MAFNNPRSRLASSNNPNEGSYDDHPDDEDDPNNPTLPSIHRSIGVGLHSNTRPLHSPIPPAQQLPTAPGGTSSLASKPHSFGGAVLSPDHARNLTTDLALQLASALSVQASHAASSRGVLPPGENINLFRGSDLADVLTGWGSGGGKSGGATATGSVFRGPPLTSTPGTPKSNQPPSHILQLLHHGGSAAPTPKQSTPGTSTPGTSASAAASPANTPTDTSSINQAAAAAAQTNPLSLLSTAEALESFASWRTHYTVWITEAWNILKWSEPSAALFWEMATMFHTLYVASLSYGGGGSGGEIRGRILGVSGSGVGGAGAVSGSSSVVSASGGGTTVKNSSLATPTTMASSNAPNYIPPLLSCGSQSSMGSVRSAGPLSELGERKDQAAAAAHLLQSPNHTSSSSRGAMKPTRHSAKELPVWLISMFLLVHCEMEAFLRCTSGEDERRFSDGSTAGSPLSAGGAEGSEGSSLDFSALLHHKSLSPRTRLHAGTHQNNANCASFILRHLRKFILLCAVPRNVQACKAIATLAARGSSSGASSRSNVHRYSGVGSNIDIDQIEQQHLKEHGNIGLTIELTVEELDRLHLVLQAPSGGLVDEPPIAIGEHILKCLAMEEIEAREGKPANAPVSPRWNLMQNGLITVADAERVLRRYLEEELTMAKHELDGEDHHDHGTEDVASKLSKLSLSSQGEATTPSRVSSIQPLSPPRSRGVSLTDSTDAADHATSKDSSYLKELSYHKLRSTTVLLEPGNDSNTTTTTSNTTGGTDRNSPTNNNNNNDGSSSVASQDQHSQASSSKTNSGAHPSDPTSNESGRLHDLHVADCSDTHFYLLQPFEHATIAACTDCTIVLGAVAGLLHVVDCERTTITSAARRVVVSNSFDVVHYLFTPSPPLLVGDNRGCQFAPYNTYYEGLREDLLATGLAAVLRSANNNSSGGSVAGDTSASPGRSGRSGSPTNTLPSLQCASNKWKVPVELCKLEVPQLPNVQTPGSPTMESSGNLSPGADDRAPGGGADVSMKTPVLLPSSEFDVLLVPVESEEARICRQLLRESHAEAANKNATNNEEEAPAGTPDVGGEEAGETTTVYSTTSTLTKGEQPPLESDYCRILADLLTLSPFHMPHDYERRVIAKAERVRTLQQAMQELNEEQRTGLEDELNRGFQDWLVTSGNLRQVLDLIHLEKRV